MRTRFHRIVTAGFLSLAWVASDAAGAVITSISEDAPPEERSLVRIAVEEENLGTQYMMRYYNNPSRRENYHREIGQSFVVPGEEAVTIDGFTLRIDDNSDLSGVPKGFTLSIYKAGSNGIPIGEAIYESLGSFPDALEHLHYITFLLDETVVLEEGERYSFQLGFTSSSGSATIRFAADKGDIYPEGRSFYYANSDTSNLSEMIYTPALRDLDFTVLYSPIPEGRTAGLILVSGIGLLVGSRYVARKKQSETVSRH